MMVGSLDGRAANTLSATQVSRWNASGLSPNANLPNAQNAYFVQNSSANLGSVTGTNTRTIARNQLLKVDITATTSSDGAHTHKYTDRGDTAYPAYKPDPYNNSNNTPVADNTEGKYDTESAGAHTHTVTIPLNGNVTQVDLDITPRSLSANAFIYLGT